MRWLESEKEPERTLDMFEVPSETAPPESNVFPCSGLMYPSEVWSDLKHRLHWYDNSMTETSSSRNSQSEADSDSLRRKLRDSLTSALEIVVSKQLVKSVLGKTVEVELAEEKLILYSQRGAEGDALADTSTDDVVAVNLRGGEVRRLGCLSGSNQLVSTHVDGGFGAKVGDKQGRLSTVSTAEQSGRGDHQSKVTESSFEDFEKEATLDVVEEAKGGIQLMEQAREVAWNVELKLFSLNGGVNKKYKEKARSLLFNLKDKSNPELRARVFNGEILPEVLVGMSAAELASKELCQWRLAKAQEFASMVVLTEADLDPRRVVKKTHKGEFEVMVEDIGVSAGAEITAVRPAFAANGRVHREVEDKSMEMEGPANDFESVLSSMTSRAQDIAWHRESEMEESSHTNGSGQDGELKTVPDFFFESSGDEIWTSALPRASDFGVLKLCKSPKTSCSEAESGNVIGFSNRRERHSGSSVWEGSLQVSATRCVSIGGFYKSGVRLELKNWPQSVEVKGRVKLGVLDKFLRDLQLSRSRAVTVLSFCPSDGRADAKRMGASLKEIADHYRMGDRAGFAEPRPGFELYLIAPGSACLDPLSDDQEIPKGALKRGDEVLVGVVVWRKGLSSSRGPKQSCSNRKDTLSNLVCESPTAPLHGEETPSSRGGLSASLNSASALSLVNVTGNTPIHSDQSIDGSSNIRDLQTRHDEHLSPVSSGQPPRPLIVPLNRVTKNSHGVMADSSLLPQWSCDRDYLPPGFIRQPKPSVPESRPPLLTVQMKQRTQDCPVSPFHVRSGFTPLVRDGDREVHTRARPGSWPKSPAKPPVGAIQNIHTVLQLDDDDLPEFNFDVEGEAQPNLANHGTRGSKTLILPGHGNNSVYQQVTGKHISDPSNRYQVHHNTRTDQPPSMEFQPVLNGFQLRHLCHQEEFSAPRSVSFIPCDDQRNGVFARDIVHSSTHNISRSMSLLGRSDHRNLLRPATDDLATYELFWDNLHHPPEVFEHSTGMPSGSTSSAAAVLNGASHTTVIDGFLQRDCPPPTIRQLGWPGLAPTWSGYPQRDSQPLLASMVTKQGQVESKGSSAGGMPLPYQKGRSELPESGADDPSETASANSDQVCSERKMEPMESNSGNARASKFSVNDLRHNWAQSPPGDLWWEPSLSCTTHTGLKRLGRRKVCPTRGKNPVLDVEGGTKPGTALHVGKLPKRERDQ